MEPPLLIVNFKNYEKAVGPKAVALAKVIAGVVRPRGTVVLAVPTTDIHRVAAAVDLPVFAQHVDGIAAGSHTGHVLAEAVQGAGARGTLLNHAERPLQVPDLVRAVKRCRELGLTSVVCANNIDAAAGAAALRPDYVAVEPPELIGGDVSVTRADPEIVRGTVRRVAEVDRRVRVLCGAGVKSGADVRTALELGSQGVLLASGVVLAADPAAAVADLLAGFGPVAR